ncbi:hypothetical protein [Pseudomonas sp. NyZ201]|uniref:hypothetical protein n=1 Tax=Pseudomonas sp. NyZ201 TaxID=3409857 RepID=UPI003CF8AEA3
MISVASGFFAKTFYGSSKNEDQGIEHFHLEHERQQNTHVVLERDEWQSPVRHHNRQCNARLIKFSSSTG